MPSMIDYTSQKFPITERHVGYIMRGSPSESFDPLKSPRHVECILPKGVIAGYGHPRDPLDDNPLSPIAKRGVPAQMKWNDEIPNAYRDVERAIGRRLLSSVLIFEVSSYQAGAFYNYWAELRKNVPNYDLLDSNCATICYRAFKEAGLIRNMSGCILPNPLYDTLLADCLLHRRKLITATGYFGIEKNYKNSGVNNAVVATSREVIIPKGWFTK